MRILVFEQYTPCICREHPDKVFVFGDNTLRKGKAGQAIIRDEPNAFGVVTKRLPSMSVGSFLPNTDVGVGEVRKSLVDLYRLSKQHTIVFPSSGIGTGLARMKEKCPVVFDYMNRILYEHFGFDNLRGEVVY